MLAKPAVVFPDAVAWAVGYLRDALEARPEAVASGVEVAATAPDPIPTRLITLRDDGGPRGATVTKTNSLALNVWAASEEDAADLMALAVALLEAAPGDGPVVGHAGTSGPFPIPDADKPHRYASVDLLFRGVSL